MVQTKNRKAPKKKYRIKTSVEVLALAEEVVAVAQIADLECKTDLGVVSNY
jgi:hypothetical protein